MGYVNDGPCAAVGCERRATTRGMCNAHYRRWLKHGDMRELVPIGPPSHVGSDDLVEVVGRAEVALVAGEFGCVVFGGCLDAAGYAEVTHFGLKTSPHRVVAERFVPNTFGFEFVTQTCGNRACCNALHLAWVDRGHRHRNDRGWPNAAETQP